MGSWSRKIEKLIRKNDRILKVYEQLDRENEELGNKQKNVRKEIDKLMKL